VLLKYRIEYTSPDGCFFGTVRGAADAGFVRVGRKNGHAEITFIRPGTIVLYPPVPRRSAAARPVGR